MAIIDEIIRREDDNTISFGDYKLKEKTKKADFEFNGDIYKVKTYETMTKLDKNDAFLYESVPGTSVKHFEETEDGFNFTVDCETSAQITLAVDSDSFYRIVINGKIAGTVPATMGNKISFNINDLPGGSVDVEIKRNKLAVQR